MSCNVFYTIKENARLYKHNDKKLLELFNKNNIVSNEITNCTMIIDDDIKWTKETIVTFAKDKYDPYKIDKNGITGLQCASEFMLIDTVNEILDSDYDFHDFINHNNETALT